LGNLIYGLDHRGVDVKEAVGCLVNQKRAVRSSVESPNCLVDKRLEWRIQIHGNLLYLE
jgi:hypothetical protein